jgi:hypothetical protein
MKKILTLAILAVALARSGMILPIHPQPTLACGPTSADRLNAQTCL